MRVCFPSVRLVLVCCDFVGFPKSFAQLESSRMDGDQTVQENAFVRRLHLIFALFIYVTTLSTSLDSLVSEWRPLRVP